MEKLRAGQALTPKEQGAHERGLGAVVLSLHQQLDAAVAEAYGWPADLPDDEVITRLVQLNQERRQEEATGHIRYLRQAYQAPGQQGALSLVPVARETATAASETVELQPWPAELAQQMQAVRSVVQQARQPLSSTQVAARFRRTKADRVQPLLETLALLQLVREVEGQALYAA
ncbi:MAG: hypothetical protein ACRYFX_15855 [Janthinobacterium lividum]